eukprot:GHVT01043217.1.p2 GENE.GHVT01043217.1~~GHVT01043217.1.p2  ORF type:complete len:203 (+),score=42.88 GHVT01043217.1:1160-1768(+)
MGITPQQELIPSEPDMLCFTASSWCSCACSGSAAFNFRTPLGAFQAYAAASVLALQHLPWHAFAISGASHTPLAMEQQPLIFFVASPPSPSPAASFKPSRRGSPAPSFAGRSLFAAVAASATVRLALGKPTNLVFRLSLESSPRLVALGSLLLPSTAVTLLSSTDEAEPPQQWPPEGAGAPDNLASPSAPSWASIQERTFLQ